MARRWLTAQQQFSRSGRKKRPPLAPWDEIAWFDIPKETAFNVNSTTAGVSVASANPQRVALILAPGGGGQSVQVSTRSTISAGVGITLASQSLPWVLLQSETGPLPTLQWFGFGANVNLIVVEIVLREWPLT